jgi:sugar/nucleoside kinase (ribokinase family)
MKLNKAILYIENETSNLTLDIIDALQIIDAASETFTICGAACDSILDTKEIAQRIEHKQAEIFIDDFKGVTIFDNYELDDNLLIVNIGNQTNLRAYVAKRLNNSKKKYGWHIINSSYARIGYLERQKNLSNFIPFDTARWLKMQIDRFGIELFNECLGLLANSNVLILGEAIIDEYIYCDALGRVTKDPLIAFEKRSKQEHLGGALAVARHFSGLGINSNIITKWANTDQEFIMGEINSNKNMKVFNLGSNKSIKKTRYVDRSSNSRVFESYELPTESDYLTAPQEIKKLVNDKKIRFDHIVLMDYGHNFFDHEITQDYLNFNVPVSVNTQSNAGNRGFNPISNYLNADIVFLNGSEVQVEMRNKISKIEKIMIDLGKKLNCKELYVTNGSAGIISWSKKEGIIFSPTFAPTIIDRTGAGDALLAVVSSLRMNNVPIEVATFFGNIAGSLLVGVMGNEKAITSTDLQFEADGILNKIEFYE